MALADSVGSCGSTSSPGCDPAAPCPPRGAGISKTFHPGWRRVRVRLRGSRPRRFRCLWRSGRGKKCRGGGDCKGGAGTFGCRDVPLAMPGFLSAPFGTLRLTLFLFLSTASTMGASSPNPSSAFSLFGFAFLSLAETPPPTHFGPQPRSGGCPARSLLCPFILPWETTAKMQATALTSDSQSPLTSPGG